MGNTTNPITPLHITFVNDITGERANVPWNLLASKFKRFDDPVYQNTNVVTSFPIRSFRRLAIVLDNPQVVAIMNSDDVELMNWLQLRDFTDAYKLYVTTTSSPLAPPLPISDHYSPTVTEDGTLNYAKHM